MYIMLRTCVLHIIFFVNIFELKADYQINDKSIPSYLNYTFTNLEDDIFPSDITISFSLTSISGTLLYSIDSDGNQLIISLNDAMTPVFDIEFSKEHFYVSIAKLCGLGRARFNKATLRIQLREKLYLQCNDGTMEYFRYNRTRKQNMAYPIPTFTKSNKLQAYLWLVNTPQMGDIYPNGAQLSGCIFNVWYKKELLTMGTHGVKGNCTITCKKDICNGGECLETYNTVPICNCTNSFMNGPHCNETLSKICYNSTDRRLQFKTIKISFNYTLLIFEVKNNLGARIKLFAKGSILRLQISYNGASTKYATESQLTENFQKNNSHIVVLVFNERTVDAQYRRNGSSWSHIQILCNRDFSREYFDQFSLEGAGIQFNYKSDLKEIRWSKLDYANNPECYERVTTPTTISTTTTTSYFSLSSSNITNTTFSSVKITSDKNSNDKEQGTKRSSQERIHKYTGQSFPELESLNNKVEAILTLLLTLVVVIVFIVIVLLVIFRRSIIKLFIERKKRFKPQYVNGINGKPDHSKPKQLNGINQGPYSIVHQENVPLVYSLISKEKVNTIHLNCEGNIKV